MRYTAKNSKNEQKTLTVKDFDRGINDETGSFADDDNILYNCVNMLYKDGVLKTRNGLSSKLSTVTHYGEYDNTVYLPFTVTDTCYYSDGKPYNIAYCCTGDDTDALIRIFLIDSLGNITGASGIDCHRLDYTTFNIPVNIFFVVAKKIIGEGVFAFVERKNSNVPLYEIYEAQDDFAGWTNVNNRIYVPTVRINGRGTRYYEAAGLSSLNYPEPEKPEELNLLSGAFTCYYTSDGLSSVFKLPYGNLGGYDNFVCRIYTAIDEYVQWSIAFNEVSKTQTFSGQQLTLTIDRTLGVARFYAGSSNYCVPIMTNCKLNNIMFTAKTADSDFTGEIVSSKGSCALNNRIYVYGNSVNPNCIYCAKTESPLYFPQGSKLFLGDGKSPVTALKVQNGKLIAFKANETYRIITSFENSLTEKETVLPEQTIYTKGDTLTAQTIDTNLGCINSATVRLCGSRLVWLASDGNVYALATTTYGNTTNIYRVSQPLGDRLSGSDGLSSAFAVTKDGQYILFVGSKAFVMNYRVRGFGYSRTYYSADDKLVSPAWFIWEFNNHTNLLGGGIVDGNPIIVSSFRGGLSFYLSLFGGETDTVIKRGETDDYTESYKIGSGFATKTFNFNSDISLKSIDRIVLNGECGSLAKLTVSDRQRKVIRHIRFGEDSNNFCMSPVMPVCKGAAVEVSCDKPFSVRNIVFKYRLIGDKG